MVAMQTCESGASISYCGPWDFILWQTFENYTAFVISLLNVQQTACGIYLPYGLMEMTTESLWLFVMWNTVWGWIMEVPDFVCNTGYMSRIKNSMKVMESDKCNVVGNLTHGTSTQYCIDTLPIIQCLFLSHCVFCELL
jgi:hypothetical protein